MTDTTGQTLFAAGKFADALRAFTHDIDHEPHNHVHYSNRSAAHAKLGNFARALEDADAAVAAQPKWAKAHARRGAALTGLGNYARALEAYQACLELDPHHAAARDAVADLRRNAAPSGAPTEPVPGEKAPTGLLSLVHLGCALAAALPVLRPGLAALSYRAALLAAALHLLLSLAASWRPLGWAAWSDARFRDSAEVHMTLVCAVLLVSVHLPFALVPLACYSAHHALATYKAAITARLPRKMKERADWLSSEQGVIHLMAFAAMSEVMVGVSSVLWLLAHGTRGLVPCLVYNRFLVRRYKTCTYTKWTVDHLAGQVHSMAHHRRVPQWVGNWCDKVQAAVARVAT